MTSSERIQKLLLITVTYFLGIISFAAILAALCTVNLNLPSSKDNVYDWVRRVMFDGKRSQILLYIFSICVLVSASTLGGLFFLPRVRLLTQNLLSKADSGQRPLGIALLSAVLNAALVYASVRRHSLGGVVFLSIAWFFVFFGLHSTLFQLGLFAPVRAKIDNLNEGKIFKRTLSLISILTVSLLVCKYAEIYKPLFNQELPFINEFFNIPSELHLGTMRIDTVQFFNQNPELGIRKWDPRDPPPVKIFRPTIPFGNSKAAIEFAFENLEYFYYDDFAKVFVIRQYPEVETIAGFIQLFKDQGTYDPKKMDEFLRNSEDRETLKLKGLTSIQRQFAALIVPEIHQQVLSRWYIHHHNFVFGPIHKLELGEDWKNIFFQYGVGMSTFMKVASQLFQDKFNLDSYYKAWTASFISYFILYILGIFFITRSRALTVSAAFFYLASIYFQQYSFIFLGPGLSPIRHFFDIAVFSLFLAYLKRSRSIFLLVSTLLLSLINFFLNPEFGAFLATAVHSYILLNWFTEEREKKGRVIVLATMGSLICHIALWFILGIGKHQVVNYYKDGFFSMVLPWIQVVLFISALAVIFFTIWILREKKNQPLFYLVLAAITYSAGLSLYYIWGGTINHIVNIASVYIFTFIIFLKFLYDSQSLAQLASKPKLYSKQILLGFSLFCLYKTSHQFKYTRLEYASETKRFTAYRWQSEKAPLLCLYSDDLFISSSSLLKKYANLENTKRIFLFSRYDNILPMMSETYQGFSANEISTYLMSTKEYQDALSSVQTSMPKYLFADMDIRSPSTDELIDMNVFKLGGLAQESVMRLERLNLVKKLFADISSNYKKIDEAGLLSVWERQSK